MATPIRPIVIRFYLGKGSVKARKESKDTARAILKEIIIQFADQGFEAAKKELIVRLESDVRAELIYLAGQFRRNVIGAPPNQRGLVGRLEARAKGGPTQNLGGLPRWAPRTARYLEEKRVFAQHLNWFDNTGWDEGGLLSQTFASRQNLTPGGADINIGSGGIFEEMFGGVSVQVLKDNRSAGQYPIATDGKAHVQVATIRVRALGALDNRMLRISDAPNDALLRAVASSGVPNARDIALHLRGGRGRYRPALEPYLKFFLEQAIPQAVTARLRRASTNGTLFRKT